MKLPLFVFLLGVALMLLPAKPKSEPVSATEPTPMYIPAEPSIDERISDILSRMDGAGRVEVMLTVKNEGETVYQTDLEERKTDSSADVKVQTVFGSANGRDGALVRQQKSPEYLGAVVLAQGGDSPAVQYHLKLAVSSLTGLGTDHITVLKMQK